ncbi:MAG: S8 family serine peptidase [Firmicutes bacterium]|nr:S8 family serine peptidase [Bacillota bacterium]
MNRLFKVALPTTLALAIVLFMSAFSFANTSDSSPIVVKADEYNWSELKAGVDYVEDEMLVTFKDDIESKDVVYEFAKRYNYDIEILSFGDFAGTKTALVRLEKGSSVEDAIRKIEEDEVVLSVSPNIIIRIENSMEQSQAYSQWHIDRYTMPIVWDMARCDNNVTVAVLDGAVDVHHEDLEDNILMSYAKDVVHNCALTSGNDNHATHVAGIISAVADNDIGVQGVSYNANIIPINIKDDDGGIRKESVVRAYNHLLTNIPENINLKVINCSFGGPGLTGDLENYVNAAAARGIITVCAAGNENTDAAHYPSDYESCISVIAVDQNGNKAGFSNYGRLCDISAPGVSITSTIHNSYGEMSGTSMAAPFVSGVIALMYAANPSLTNDQVKHYLYSTAEDVGPSGRDNNSGWGIIDPYRAVFKAKEGYWKRLNGGTRYDTMRMVSNEGWSDDSCDTAIVATGESFPDALAATSLAGIHNCPVILTKSSTLSQQAAGEIQRLGVENVILIGGSDVVSNTVKSQIESIVGSGHVSRIYGATRYDTAVNIYNNGSGWSDTLIVTTGLSAPDSLSIAPYAYATKSPVFLAGPNGNLSSNVRAAISSGSFDKAIIIGSSSNVSESTENFLKSQLGLNKVYRISGSTRYVTSSKIAKWACGEDQNAPFSPDVILGYSHVAIANGGDNAFPDGLSGGAFCGHNRSVMLLIDNSKTFSNNVTLTDNVSIHIRDVELGYAIGSNGVISDSLLDSIESFFMGCL